MEERIPDGRIRIEPIAGAAKGRNLALFKAGQFRSRWRVGKRNVQPLPPAHDDQWWQCRFRVQLDRKWLGSGGCKYTYYTMDEIMVLVARLLAGEEI